MEQFCCYYDSKNVAPFKGGFFMPKKHLGISKDEKRNTWMIHTRISLPDGSSATVTKRGFKSEKEAFDALEDIKAERLKEYQSAERFISWQDACMEYYHYYSTKVKTTTARDSFLTYFSKKSPTSFY